jgi:hypothetical protein
MTKPSSINPEILEAALLGLEAQRAKLSEQIAQVRGMLGGKNSPVVSTTGSPVTPQKRILSADARKRIAAAQKRRWAAFHKERGY